MAASLNQIAELLAERAGRQFDHPFKQELKTMVSYWRARVIRDALNRKNGSSDLFSVWLEYELEEAQESEYIRYPDRPILRTKECILKPIRYNDRVFEFIGKLDKRTSIPLMDPYKIGLMHLSRHTAMEPRCSYINKKIYVYNSLNIPAIAIKMIPENLEEYENSCFCGDPDNEKMLLPEDLVQKIVQGILETELKIKNVSQTEESEVSLD